MSCFSDEIIEDLIDGKEEAFRAVYIVEFDNITYFVNKYVNNISASQDIVQDTFATLWIRCKDIDSTKNVRAYIYTIAKNIALNHLRKQINKCTGSLEERESAINYKALSDPSVDEKIDALLLEEMVNKLYDRLPENVRESFIMNRHMGYTYEEIAIKKGVSVKVVEYEISLALRMLREKIKKYSLF